MIFPLLLASLCLIAVGVLVGLVLWPSPPETPCRAVPDETAAIAPGWGTPH